jgi:hypothetical protein
MANKMPIGRFMSEVRAALKRGDGYIMGATGQDPQKWSKSSWWFTQYSGNQKTKALYWRENCARVWDCNGLAEGIYKDFTGVDINSKARYNYSGWCGVKGSGMIPAKHRAPGVAVFWGKTAGSITHVAYLDAPVDAGNPAGDWYIIEARGVMYGVVRTKLYSRKPNYWGLMTKYFDYDNTTVVDPVKLVLGDRTLREGDEGNDVKLLQEALIRLGYDCGKWGADGDFGDATELAVMAFQRSHNLEDDGIYGQKSHEAMEKALAAHSEPVEEPRRVKIVGGNCWARTADNTDAQKLGVTRDGDTYEYQGMTSENGWHLIIYKNQNAWVSGKYGKLLND